MPLNFSGNCRSSFDCVDCILIISSGTTIKYKSVGQLDALVLIDEFFNIECGIVRIIANDQHESFFFVVWVAPSGKGQIAAFGVLHPVHISGLDYSPSWKCGHVD